MQFYEAGLRIVEKPIPTYYGDEICYVNGLAYAFNCVGSALKYRLHKAGLRHEPKFDLRTNSQVYRKADPYCSHAHILRWIEQERPAEVLEIGTATGYLTAEMKQLGCKVTGVEQDAEMAKIARQYCESMLVGDIETLDLAGLRRYDAVILGEAFEHVRNPSDVLQKVGTLLKPGGRVLISLPNVANIWLRLGSLLGRFHYGRVGVIDESRLRFTLQTGRQLAAAAGLDVIRVHTTPIPLPALVPATREGQSLSFLHLLNWSLTKLRKTLFGYQFILLCRPKEKLTPEV
jgi:2-polyprenyl-3-methyl-5-hydroxy-6-metoxy-1,4-benzoquinol methylase